MKLPPTPTMNSHASPPLNNPRSRGGFGRPANSVFTEEPGHRAGFFRFRRTIMTDPQSTPEPAIDETTFDQKHREYARRADDIRAANKIVLFDSLAAAGIETVTVIFDGYGDSGQIERIDVEPGQGTILLPSDRIEIARTAWENPEIERQTLTVREAIETLVYDFLIQVHSGWEINDGAYGEFTFDVAERTIKLDYNERYTSSEHYSHEF
jgi:hypothetical protein